MTTNKPEVVGYRYKASKSRGKWHYQQHWPTSDNMAVTERGECDALIRLSDYEALQAECEKLRAAIRRLCNIYVVDDYYEGQQREEHLDMTVNRSIDAALAAHRKGGEA